MHWLFAIALMSVPLVVGEMMKKQFQDLPPELSRKFVHITAAVCAAFLPLLLSLKQISLLAIAMTPGMLYMHHKGTLRSMSSRSQRSYGDVFFGLGCAGAAFRRCFKSVDPVSDCSPKLVPIDEEPNHQIVHLFRLGETDRATDQSLDPRP